MDARRGCGNFGPPVLSRRQMLRRAGAGFGTLALAGLLADEGRLFAEGPAGEGSFLDPGKLNGKARRVLFLFMGGGPSHVDTFDPKPELIKLNGKDVPPSIAKGVPKIPRSRLTSLYAPPYKFARHGKSGIEVSELFPETAKLVDDLCILRSCRHETPIHAPAEYISTTGTQAGDRPSLGAWINYGLGSENKDLPGFVVLSTGEEFGSGPAWAAGFLPARFQGTVVKPEGIPNIKLPAGFNDPVRRAQLELIGELNRRYGERHAGHSELEARLRTYELAFRMQTAAPEAFDLAKESAATKALYGMDQKETADVAGNAVLARRLLERGVRFVQLRVGGWDAHGDLKKNHDAQCRKVDRPIAGLLTDLKSRGLLESTLVIWGGEFGRTPTAENPGKSPGRDHSPSGYTMWLAGGGVKGGQVIGSTDPVGYAAVERPIHPNDLHATILKAMGIEQRRLYYLHHNRKEMVTVNGGEVIEEVFG
jgi:hypothetical protein